MSPAPEPQIFTPSPMSAEDMSSLASLIATLSYNLGNTMLDPSPTMSSNFAASSLLSQYMSAMSAGASLGPPGPITAPTTLMTSTVNLPQPSSGTVVPSTTNSANISSMLRGTSSLITSAAASSGAARGSNTASSASTSTSVGGAAQSSTYSPGATASGESAPVNSSTIHQNSSSMSSGTQAAIAVPIVLLALGAVVLAFLCVRRRKSRSTRSNDGSSIDEKSNQPVAAAVMAQDKKRKRWTRHLRVFSFDTELLMGSRYSSTNSIRSRQTGSMRSTSRNLHSSSSRPPSERSADEVAPAYRDAISAGTSTHPQSLNGILAGSVMAAAAANNMKRNASTSTAPPPYRGGSRYPTPTSSPQTLTQARQGADPFSDPHSSSPVVSPVGASPFDDSADNSPNISRNSSLLHRVDEDDASVTDGASDAASIHQATLARNASTMSGARQARMIDVRRSH